MNTIWVLAFCHRSLCEEHWIWEVSFRYTFRMKCRIVVFPLYMIQSILKVLRQRHFENLCWNISVTYKKAFSYSIRKAKPVLCFARIAKAILGGITLHNSIFLFHKKTPLQEQNSCGGVVFLNEIGCVSQRIIYPLECAIPNRELLQDPDHTQRYTAYAQQACRSSSG